MEERGNRAGGWIGAAYRRLTDIQFMRYVVVGGIATVVDWGSFYLLAIVLDIYYQASLVLSFTLGVIANYTLNKLYTFRCRSRQIAGQFSVHVVISVVSLLMSMGLMFILVGELSINKMVSRIATTFIMLFVNFLMHKYITFNKRIFR